MGNLAFKEGINLKKTLIVILLTITFVITGCGENPTVTSPYVGSWRGSMIMSASSPSDEMVMPINLTVGSNGDWTGVLTTPSGSGIAGVDFSEAMSGTSNDTTMTASETHINGGTTYTDTLTGTFITASGHMKGTVQWTSTDPDRQTLNGTFDLTPFTSPYEGTWSGVWEERTGGTMVDDSGVLNLIVARDGSVGGTFSYNDTSYPIVGSSNNNQNMNFNFDLSNGGSWNNAFLYSSTISLTGGNLMGDFNYKENLGKQGIVDITLHH